MDSAALIDSVVAAHPRVTVDSWVDKDGDETVTFTPANAMGVSVTVCLRSDSSVTVEAGSFFTSLDEWPPGEERLGVASDLVLSFAKNGYLRLRNFWGYLSLGMHFSKGLDDRYIAGPASGFWGVDEYVGRLGYSVAESLDAWHGTRAANSD